MSCKWGMELSSTAPLPLCCLCAAANLPLPPDAPRSPHPQAAALIGAVVTGVLARRRRVETQTLNDKLRQINAELRRQREQQVRIPMCCTSSCLRSGCWGIID